MIVLGVAVAVAYGWVVKGPNRSMVVPAIVAGAIHPALAAAYVGVHFGFVRSKGIRDAKSESVAARIEQLLAVELVASGVEAGVSFDVSVETAIRHIREPVASEMTQHIRLSHRPILIDDIEDPSPVDTMFRAARSSATSGAPLSTDLRALSDSERDRDDAVQREQLERLPVKMLFPLAFLILPGFLLVAVAPSVVGGISKLTL